MGRIILVFNIAKCIGFNQERQRIEMIKEANCILGLNKMMDFYQAVTVIGYAILNIKLGEYRKVPRCTEEGIEIKCVAPFFDFIKNRRRISFVPTRNRFFSDS